MWLVLIVLSLFILGSSFLSRLGPDITAYTSKRMGRSLDKRMAVLESYMAQVLENKQADWPELKNFPSDMVVYRYVNDSLKSWHNQFTIDNDDISSRVLVQYVSNLRSSISSPLKDIDTLVSYLNIGPQWYLVKSMDDGSGTKVIGGLMVRNTLDVHTYNGVNPKLKVSDRFAVYPISTSGGSAVYVQGVPLMKVVQENAHIIPLWPDSQSVWISLLMMVAGLLIFLSSGKSRHRMWMAILLNTAICSLFFLLGYGMRFQTDSFSPTVYADGGLLYSLGAVLIVNLWITANVTFLYISRYSWLRFLQKSNKKMRQGVYSSIIVFLILFISVYTHLTFCSLIANSNINLELYQVGRITLNTVYVYISYLSLVMTAVMLIQMLRPVLKRKFGFRYDMFSRKGRMIVSISGAIYLLALSSALSLKREEGRVEIWANRLSIDRNPAFEIQLRSTEADIANDGLIPSLLSLDPNFSVIINRITESYLSKMVNDYDINLYMFKEADANLTLLQYFNDRMRNGTPLADNSRFMYSRSPVGRAQYTGFFTYYNADVGLVRLLIAIENKVESEGRGYDAVINEGRTGNAALPQSYSYGKYLNDKLVGYRGDFAYPTIFSGRLKQVSDSASINHATWDKYVHFVTPVSESDEEYVVISRRVNDVTKYMVAGFMLMLLSFIGSGIMSIGRRRKAMFENNYYKQRLNVLLFVSLFATLVSMALISVLFIYKRNESNMNDLMASKINTIQSLVEAQSRHLRSPQYLLTTEFYNQLDNISKYTRSDISIYTVNGKVLTSTYPEIFDRLTIGTRLNGEAYRNIMYENKRYFIHKERVEGHVMYSMSAPVFDSDGSMQVIVSAPYTDEGLGFKNDAIFHACFIVAVFLILFFLTRMVSGKVVYKMFHPLIDMGKKMKLAKSNGLEYIIYQRDDEIATLVDSYNRMVHDLYESNKRSALIERNKAWNEMARQIAHEIKNPLTPIKLQIQRIIRLKSRNDPAWQDKFEIIAPVILESIDQLTDTANEFSTFAKLYTEEPVEINLDRLALDQIALLDGRDGIEFQYFGLKNAMVMGPKPQLTRVIVNLLTNSVQAIEGGYGESRESGLDGFAKGRISLSIRNSFKDGFYDIVIEDNGPGVKDENRNKLFTPNFTTKSSGTGLGLAICKSILDLCGAEIFYSKSFTLGGACFTIRYPKKA